MLSFLVGLGVFFRYKYNVTFKEFLDIHNDDAIHITVFNSCDLINFLLSRFNIVFPDITMLKSRIDDFRDVLIKTIKRKKTRELVIDILTDPLFIDTLIYRNDINRVYFLMEKYRKIPKMVDNGTFDYVNIYKEFLNTTTIKELYNGIFLAPIMEAKYCNKLINDVLHYTSYNNWIEVGSHNYLEKCVQLSRINKNLFNMVIDRCKNLANVIWRYDMNKLIHEDKVFIVKQTSKKESIPIHMDNSTITFKIQLSNREDFSGGGTWFKKWNRTLNPEQGLCNIYYSGITNTDMKLEGGTRYILVVYLRYTDDIYLNSVEQIFNDGKKQFGLHNKQQVWNVVKNQL